MRSGNTLITGLLLAAAVCLIKLAFFGSSQVNLVPPAQAQTGIVEWNNALRIVTTGENGATTYVWDYQGKTSVRKYFIENNELKMKVYELK